MLSRLYRSNKVRQVFYTLCCGIFLADPLISQEFEPGVIDPFQSQLPVSLWNDIDTDSSSTLMREATPANSLAINRLRVILALAQSFPSLTPDNSNEINSARLNMLINHGVLDAAEALAQTMNWYSPVIRAEVETISLLTTRPDRYCARLLAKQYIEFEQGFSIYCMVRSNQWQEAIDIFKDTSETYETLRKTTLHRFLELDGDNNPILDEPWKTLPNPFDFILDEAFGRPRGEAELPPSYTYYAREIGSSPLAELEFTEKLVRWGALPENVLFASYRNYSGEQMGKIYQRTKIAKEMSLIDVNDPPKNFNKLINDAIIVFSDAGLLQPFASQIAPNLAKINLEDIGDKSLKNKIIRLSLLGRWSKMEWSKSVPRDDFPLILAFALRHPDIEFNDLLNTKLPTKQARVIHTAFILDRTEIQEQKESGDDKLIEIEKVQLEKSAGEEILLALNILEDFVAQKEEDLVRAFHVLYQSGQDQIARDIAIHMLFGGQTP